MGAFLNPLCLCSLFPFCLLCSVLTYVSHLLFGFFPSLVQGSVYCFFPCVSLLCYLVLASIIAKSFLSLPHFWPELWNAGLWLHWPLLTIGRADENQCANCVI